MDLLLPWLALLAGCLALAFVWGRGRRRGRAFVEVAPHYRSFFRHQKLTEPDHFLALASVIVSGHPDRHVARVTIGAGPEALTAYLKREHRVSWRTRLDSFLAGFGFRSRSLREARVLRALQRDGIGCPEWLAAGEDGRGRAFVLVREVACAVDLGAFLRAEADTAVRRRTARRLGAALARLHDAGFAHPDLYTKHILVRPADGAIAFLDWQRSRRCRALTWRARGRDLAALHATLADDLATPRERLACLREYLRHEARCRAVEGGTAQARPLRQALARVQRRAQQLLARRHIREKRQPRPPADTQNWVCLDGEALCVTPTLSDLCAGAAIDWLALDRQPAPLDRGPTRRWLLLPGGRRTLLVRRRDRRPLAALWAWLRGRPLPSPEQRQAGLLFRLQRHEVPAPRVLAMGRRRRLPWQVESFLLTEPAADTVPLTVWLSRRDRRPAARRALLRQAGELLHRLHEAGCYLSPRLTGFPLAVRVVAGSPPAPVLDRTEAVRACRRRQIARARRDLARARRALIAAGCGRTDVARFLAAYHRRTPALAGLRRRGRPAGRAAGPTSRPALLPAPGAVPAGPVLPPGPPPVNRETFWQRLLRGARRLRERPDWPLFAGADWPDRIMDVAVTDRFSAKQGRSTGRWVLHRPAGPGEARRLAVYLKRHYALPWWQGLLAALWPRGGWSPALQEWKHLEWARQQGVPVPEVVAAAEYIGPWGRFRSFLAVEELADMLPLHEAIPLAATRLDAQTFRRWKRTLVAEMARLTRMLHDRRCFHKDLYLCHFYVARDDTACLPSWRGRVFLIDLHRLSRHAWTWRLWQTKDLAQLLYSSAVPGVDARDQLYFWAHYRGAGPRRGADRWLRRFVLFKWRRYRRHNLRRKARQKQRTKDEG